jgi:hypothetical protein
LKVEEKKGTGIHANTTEWIQLLDAAHVSMAYIRKPSLADLQSFSETNGAGIEIEGKNGSRELVNLKGPSVAVSYSLDYFLALVKFLQDFRKRNGKTSEDGVIVVRLSEDGPVTLSLAGLDCEVFLAPRKATEPREDVGAE